MLGMLAGVVIFGCGKKGDPFLPKKQDLQVLRSVKAQYVSGIVIFKGNLVASRARKAIQAGRIRLKLDYTHYSNGKVPCEGCPIELKEHDMIQGSVSQDGKFTAHWVPPENQGLYVLRLQVMGEDSCIGPPSRILSIDIP